MKPLFGNNLGLWISILGLFVAAAALYFSYQANEYSREANQFAKDSNRIANESNQIALDANRISQEQATAHLSVLDMSPYDFGVEHRENSELWHCPFALQIANLGGSSAALVTYTATYIYQDLDVTVYGDGSPMIWRNNDNIPPFYSLAAFLSEDSSFSNLPTEQDTYKLRLSEMIEPRGVKLLYVQGGFAYPPNPPYNFSTDPQPDFLPVELMLTFKTSIGGTFSTPTKPCIYLQPK